MDVFLQEIVVSHQQMYLREIIIFPVKYVIVMLVGEHIYQMDVC